MAICIKQQLIALLSRNGHFQSDNLGFLASWRTKRGLRHKKFKKLLYQ